jgi:undecaprenyl-phosphate galactose phosphotransferase
MIDVILRQRNWAVKLNYYLSPGILVVTDYLAVCLGIYTSIFFRDVIVAFCGMQSNVLTIKDIHLYFVLPIIYIGFIAYADMYRRRMMFYQCISAMFRISTYVAIIIILIGYFINIAEPISRVFMALFWIVSFFFYFTRTFLDQKTFS